MKLKANRFMLPLLCGVVGIIVFLLLYGVGPLDVTNDQWILNGYDESDIIQRYAGWTSFRYQPIQFPLGKTMLTGYPYGANIVHMDSIPIVAIFFRFFSPVLPPTFQYEGIYMLVCFFLQGYASGLLLDRLFSKKTVINTLLVVIASLFFILAPIFIERSFRHSSLASHYLILFSMYLYLEYRTRYIKKTSGKLPWAFILIIVLSVGITPYFMPMCMIFVLLTSIDYLRYVKKDVKPIVFFAVNIITVLLIGFALGSISSSAGASRGGYGFYSMNLTSPINPSGLGDYHWSMFMRKRTLIRGNHDGFNYMGFGFILMFFSVLILKLHKFVTQGFDFSLVKSWLKRNIYYLILCIFATMFAVTHIITFDGATLTLVKLPDAIKKVCGIFRASSRMFYPVYYSIMLFSIYSINDLFNYKSSTKYMVTSFLIISFFLVIQLMDMSKVMVEKRLYMDAETSKKNAEYSEILWNDKLQNVDNQFEYCMCFDDDANYIDISYERGLRKVIIYAGKNNLMTNIVQVNTPGKAGENFLETKHTYYCNLLEGNIDSNMVYVAYEYEPFRQAKNVIDQEKTPCEFIETDGAYFIIPKVR